MSKADVINRINGLNEYMLEDSNKELLLLKLCNDYITKLLQLLIKMQSIRTGIPLTTNIALKLGTKLKHI